MDDSQGMHRGEGRRHLFAQLGRFLNGQRTLAQPVMQRTTRDPFHHQVGLTSMGPRVQDSHNMPVIQPPQESRFAQHTRGSTERPAGVQHLQRHPSGTGRLPGPIHLSGTSPPHQLQLFETRDGRWDRVPGFFRIMRPREWRGGGNCADQMRHQLIRFGRATNGRRASCQGECILTGELVQPLEAGWAAIDVPHQLTHIFGTGIPVQQPPQFGHLGTIGHQKLAREAMGASRCQPWTGLRPQRLERTAHSERRFGLC